VTDRIAFIFDMDGVIVDSTAAHVEAWRRYLEPHGVRIADIADRMLGKHNDELVRDFFAGRDLTAEEIFEHGARKEALYREMLKPVFEHAVVPGVVSFVRRYGDIPMAIASNAEPANVNFILENAGLRDSFRAVVNGHDVERPKPFPDIFLRAAELLGVEPLRCIVFEDSLTGVAAARAAGMRVVGVRTTLPAFDNVDVAIGDFRELAGDDWLRRLMGDGYPSPRKK
jgi:beta-phosphoglucomutase family hydrolase